MKKYNFSLLTFCVFLFACSGGQEEKAVITQLPYYKDASFSPHWYQVGSDSLADFHQIPDFKLINQHGDTINQDSLEGKVFVVDFIFTTCPGICPKMTKNMALVQKVFNGNDGVALLSHSVTPIKDSVPQLKKYADLMGITWKNWHLLTGDKEQIYNLGRNAYFVEQNIGEEKSMDDFLHTENFVLVDQNKRIRGIYNGLNKNSVSDLINDIHILTSNNPVD